MYEMNTARTSRREPVKDGLEQNFGFGSDLVCTTDLHPVPNVKNR